MSAPSANRLPALDGLRAISILFVVIGHIGGTRFMPLQPNVVTGNLAGFGVRVFFVISGFLITTLLIGELKKTGTISLKDFYVRRTYRIFPAFYAFLAVILALWLGGFIDLMKNDLLAGATYTMNFHRPRSWYVGHLWSLSVEEQFYFLWPATMLFLGKERALYAAAFALVAAPLVRVGIFLMIPSERLGIGETFPTVFDSLASGCLLAGVRHRLTESARYMAFSRSIAFVLVPIAGLVALFVPRVSFDFLIGQTIQNITIALTVDWAVREHDTAGGRLMSRILDAGPITWLGRLSYSLYLWQQPFVNRHGSHILHSFPLNLVGAFGIAILSYHLIEQPFLRLRERRAKAKKARAAATA